MLRAYERAVLLTSPLSLFRILQGLICSNVAPSVSHESAVLHLYMLTVT